MLGGTILGGSYAIEMEGPYKVPVFRFRTSDLGAVRALIASHAVTFDARFVPGRTDCLAYCLLVPDLGLEPAWIAIEPKDLFAVATGHGVRNFTTQTRIVDDAGGEIDLDQHARGLRLDWAGGDAVAQRAFELAEAGVDPEANLERAEREARRCLADIESSVVAAHELLPYKTEEGRTRVIVVTPHTGDAA